MQSDSQLTGVKMTSEDPTGEMIKIACRACRNNTNHVVLKSILVENPWDQDPGIRTWQRYQIIQCQGCEILAFLAIDGDSMTDNETGKPHEQLEVFPVWPSGRDLIEGANTLPKQLRQVYAETMKALNKGQPILCGLGIRAVVAKERGAKGKDLEKRIDHLVELKVLTEDGAKILHRLRTLGNKAAHEAKAHRTDELALAMDVVDHLLAAVYTLPKRAARAFE